ncbi:MAG TPA: hypothetical protein VGD43_01490, partial [Micromonospora sp.]
GTVLAHVGTELRIWSSARLDILPRTSPDVGHQQMFGSGLVVLGRRSVCLFSHRGALVVDVTTGRRIAEPDWKWAVPVRWRGAPALLVRGEGELLRLVDAESLEVVGDCVDPVPHLKSGSAPGRFTYSAKFGVCVLEAMEHRSGFAVARLTDDGRWERTGLVDDELTGSAWCASGHVWIHDGRGGLWLLDLAGRPLWHTAGIQQAGRTLGAPVAVHDPRGGVVVVGDGAGLTAWPVPDGPARWSVEVPLGVNQVAAHPDGESFLSASPSGEIARRRLDTGEVLSRCSVNDSVRGARISRTCGLSEPVLDGLALAGAIILDT